MKKWAIPRKKPEPIVTKICMGDYVRDPYHYAKFHHNPINPFRPPNVRKFASSDSASFFGGGGLSTAYSQDPSPIFTINTSNDVVSRKDMPFGVSKTKIYISTPFFPQNGNFWPIFDGTSEIFGSKSP